MPWPACPAASAPPPPTSPSPSTGSTTRPCPTPWRTWTSAGTRWTGTAPPRRPGTCSTRSRRAPRPASVRASGRWGGRATLRRMAAVLAMALGVTAIAACQVPGGTGGGPGGGGQGACSGGPSGAAHGYVDAGAWRARQDGYLRCATEQLTPTSPTSVLAHLTRAGRDRRFRFDASAIGPDDFAATFAKIDAYQDT